MPAKRAEKNYGTTRTRRFDIPAVCRMSSSTAITMLMILRRLRSRTPPLCSRDNFRSRSNLCSLSRRLASDIGFGGCISLAFGRFPRRDCHTWP